MIGWGWREETEKGKKKVVQGDRSWCGRHVRTAPFLPHIWGRFGEVRTVRAYGADLGRPVGQAFCVRTESRLSARTYGGGSRGALGDALRGHSKGICTWLDGGLKFSQGLKDMYLVTPSESTWTLFSIMIAILRQLAHNPFVCLLPTWTKSASLRQPRQTDLTGQQRHR